jgi:Hydantoinase B/oxoprolinase
VRRIEFRAPLSGALLANHRRIAPFGVDGGAAGVVGGGRLLRAGGGMEEIGATVSFEVEVGDVLTILTPGGGGFGAAGDGVRGGGSVGGEFDAAGGSVHGGGSAGGEFDPGGGGVAGGGSGPAGDNLQAGPGVVGAAGSEFDDQRESRRGST